MKRSSKKKNCCIICKGTGWIKRSKRDECTNCEIKKTHICYLCENIQFQLKGTWKICEECIGIGKNNSIS